MNAPSSRKQVGDRWNKVVLHVCTETRNRDCHRQPQEEGGCVYVCVCVCERERERERLTHRARALCEGLGTLWKGP